MSKEEVYQQQTLKLLSNANGTRQDIIYAAMDEYARIQAISFAKFCDDLRIFADAHFNVLRNATTEELYNEFLLNKKL